MRGKVWTILLLAACAVVVLAAATQAWVRLELRPDAAAFTELSITGQELNPSLSPVALAVLAGALALSIAGRVFRFVLGGLVTLLGIALAAIGSVVLADPIASAEVKLSAITGLAGSAQASLVTSTAVTPWPPIAVAAGVIAAALGVVVLVTGGRWRAGGRRYAGSSTPSSRPVGAVASSTSPDRISDWDSQNDGVDLSDLGTDEDPDLPSSGSQETPSRR